MLKRHLNILLFVACVLCAQAVFAQTTTVEPIEQTLCIDAAGNILQTERIQLTDNQTFIWIREQGSIRDTLDESSWRILVTETQDATYTCHLISTEVKAENNLMANGDFETIEGEIGTNIPVPSTFSSSYKFAGWDPHQYFAPGMPRPAGSSNLYAITHDATYFWKDFATVKPHGGKYLALFDAGKSGDAWRATTKENTALVLEKDSVYLFSYWAAHPNIRQYSNSPAIFQFVIKCKDAAHKDYVEYKLGAEYELDGTHNKWVYQEVKWKAPMSADSVIISVHDCNDNDGTGNDFCLDDIMFQKTTYIEKTIIKTYIFHLKVCNTPPCGKPVEHQQDTAVYEKDLPIEWHGIVFTEAKKEIVEVYDEETGCLTDRYTYELTIKPMVPPCPEVQTDYRDTTVCDTLMPYTWLGHEFTQADTYSYMEQDERGCDIVWHVWNLYVEKCCPELQIDNRDTTVCETDLPMDWLGHTFTQADTYSYSEQDVRGCETIRHIWRLSVKDCCPTPVIESDQLTICSNELPYTWHNLLFTAAADSVIENYDSRDCLISRYTYRLTVKQGIEMYSKWTDVIFVPNTDSLYTAYQWYQNGQPIDGANEQFYHNPNGLSGLYHCVMQTRDGGTEETCPAAFGSIDRSAEYNPGDAPKQLVAQRTYNIGAHLQIIVSVFDDNSTTAEKYWK